jgi:hypothetical protein
LSLGIRSNGGTNITISAEESNLIDSTNNVTTADQWPYPNTNAFPCESSSQFPIRFALMQGNYDVANYTSGSALALYNTSQVYECVTMSGLEPYLLFAPLSDNATYHFSFGQSSSYLVSDQLTASGYWTEAQSSAAFHPFPAGSYTVLAEDEWGGVVLLHFDVVVTTVTETVSGTISSTSGVNSSSSSSSTCTAAAETLTLCHTTSTTYAPPTNSSSTSTNGSNTFLTSCSVTGVGGLELRILSDSTGSPVSGENITAVDTLGCDIVGQPPETQVVYLNSFSSGTGGWLTPVFPGEAEPGGQLAFMVVYQGATYRFTEDVPPIGTLCVTLHVPSGNVTTAAVMNGSGSYCS